MKSTIFIKILLGLVLLSGCSTSKKGSSSTKAFKVGSLALFDKARNRPIPVALYFPNNKKAKQQVIIFSHGYGANKGGDNTAYSYLTTYLASQGYFVASIQHELATDELLPMTGKPQETRRPNWERGVKNILFVINELKEQKPNLDYQHLTLIGHSNGGDMTMLFAHKYPELVNKIISLDNRRMLFPREKRPQIYSLRSSDQPADEGVLPSIDEQKLYRIKIIKLKKTRHNDMDDHANEDQRKEINRYVLGFLRD